MVDESDDVLWCEDFYVIGLCSFRFVGLWIDEILFCVVGGNCCG